MTRGPGRSWPLAALTLIASGGCAGGEMMIQRGQQAAELGDRGAVQTLDGKPLRLAELSRQGPVLLVFLRGFS